MDEFKSDGGDFEDRLKKRATLKTAYKICAWLIVALGGAHVLFTLHDYDEFSTRALWFCGSGLALVFAGFLNVAHLRAAAGRDPVVCARSPC